MRKRDDTHSTARRMVLLAGNAMLVAALLIVTSPWTSGLFTLVAQRRLTAAVAPVTATQPRRAVRIAEAANEDARDWRSAAEGAALGRLRIPAIAMDAVVVKGVRDTDLRRGPGWVPGTSPPGSGNCGIAGHRTTYLGPFRDIDRLAAGDRIVLETRTSRYTYRVSTRFFVARDDADILRPTTDPTLTLTSCHPPYSDQFRIVVQARLASTERR